MRRPLPVAVFAAIMYVAFVQQHALANVRCARAAAPQAQAAYVRSIANEINRQGLEAFRSMPLRTAKTIALGPVVLWYSRFFERMRTGQPSSAQTIARAQAFASAFSKVPGREFATRIWVNAAGLGHLSCVSNAALRATVYANGSASGKAALISWLKQYGSTEGEKARAWMRRHNERAAQTPLDQFARDAAFSPPFSGITIFQQRAVLDGPASPTTLSVRPSFWNQRGVTGVRMDSVASDLSLYVFASMERAPILRFAQGLSADSWRAVVAGFKPQRDLGQNSAQWISGTSLLNLSVLPSLQYGRLRVDGSALGISTVSAVHGSLSGVKVGVLRARPFGRILGAQNRVYVIVDKKTGAIVFIGANAENGEHVRGTL